MSIVDFFQVRPVDTAPQALVETGPTPLLAFLAGEHAEAVARVWPAPHGEFIALPAARRHAAALALIYGPGAPPAQIRRLIEAAPLRDVAAFAFRHPPRGLARALGRLGEQLWTEPLYGHLIAHLRDEDAAQVLRHAEAIDVALLQKLAALPAALRKARIVALTPSAYGAQTLAEAFALALRINPRRTARDIAMAWARADTTERLFAAATEALAADRFGQPAAPPAMPKPYRAIVTRAALQAEALRFRNCIASYVFDIGADVMAVYVREGEPAAMIALKRDVGGWRMAEALGVDNTPLPEHLLLAIAGDFIAAGARVGQPVRAIEDRLETFTTAAPATTADAVTVAAQLGLGQLWR